MGKRWEKLVSEEVNRVLSLLEAKGVERQRALALLLEMGARALLPLYEALPGLGYPPVADGEASEDASRLSSPGGGPSPEELLRELLGARGLEVVSLSTPTPRDGILDGLAWEMGSNVRLLIPFLRVAKQSLNKGTGGYLFLGKLPPEEVDTLVPLLRKLHQYGLMESFYYDNREKRLSFRITQVGVAQHFLTGDWMERYVARLASHLLGPEATVFRGTKLRFPWGGEGELDVLVLRSGRIDLWVEVKTGLYVDRIARYQEIRKLLDLPKERALMAVLEEEAETVRAQSLILDYSILRLEDLEGYLKEVVLSAPLEASQG